MVRWFFDEKEERRAAAGKLVGALPRAEGRAEGNAVPSASRPRGLKVTEGLIRRAGEAKKIEMERELEAALLKRAASRHVEAVQRQCLDGWRTFCTTQSLRAARDCGWWAGICARQDPTTRAGHPP